MGRDSIGQNKILKVLFIASEADPIIKVGGLGDVVGTLPHYLINTPSQELDGYTLDVRIAVPLYPCLPNSLIKGKKSLTFSVPYWPESITGCSYLSTIQDVPLYLVSGPPINETKTVYSSEDQDVEKFIFFSLGALETCKMEGWKPDIIHAHDWHGAPAVYAAAQKRNADPFIKNSKLVLTVHNLPFMGGNASAHYPKFGLVMEYDPKLPDWANHFVLPLGLSKADAITVVSPTYAREILTWDFGRGLDGYLNSRKDKIFGILNGLDYDNWNPETDTCIKYNFNLSTLRLRKRNKAALQKELGLDVNFEIPLLVSVGRMEYQKGFDLTIQTLRQSRHLPWQAVVMGTGNLSIESECRQLAEEFPARFKAIIQYNPDLARRIYASGDLFLMPSRYEPCGLSQLIAMRYGCIPLARATGGLRDTIIDDPQLSNSTGFLFDEPSSGAMAHCLNRALDVYTSKRIWRKLQLNAMQQNFTWHKSALAYARIYLNLLGHQ